MADNRRYVYQRLRSELGLTPAQAAGAVGGLGGESGRTLDPNAVNPTSGALGIGQWLGGRAQGVKKGDLRSQTNHLIAELKGPERGALNQLRSTHTLSDATRAWVEGFERPSPSEISSSMPARLGYARDAFSAFHGLSGGASSGGSASSGASTTSLPSGTAPDLGSAQSLVPLLQALKSQPQQRSSAGIAAPAFSAQAALPGGYQSPVSGGGPAPATDMNALLAAVQTAGGGVPGAQQQGGAAASADASGANTGPASSGSFGKSHSPLLELIHNTGSGPGFGVKDGRKVNGSQVFADVWAGHKTHVHVAAGPKTVVQLGRLAQQMGLHVGENPHFGGVSPVHVPGSYHYKGEAIDVSGDPRKMNAYAQRVERLYGLG